MPRRPRLAMVKSYDGISVPPHAPAAPGPAARRKIDFAPKHRCESGVLYHTDCASSRQADIFPVEFLMNIPISSFRILRPHHACRAAALSALLLGCANQMRPSGGPVDEVPPRVVRCSPAPGSVSVPRKANIEIVFSEWIDPSAAKKSVTVFPPPQEDPGIAVRGKTMEVSPDGLLADSTTYHVEITAVLKDLHGVSIGKPYHFVFSTGPTLDSSRIRGCVKDPKGNRAQPKVALFRHDTASPDDTVLLATPSYLAQTDTLGRFALDFIRAGTYDILAFIDSDNNNRLTSKSDQAFAPQQRRIVLADSAGPLVLFPVACDTSAKTIASFKPLADTLALGQWEAETRLDDTTLLDSTWRIVPVDTSDTAPPPPSVVRYVPVRRSPRFVLIVDPPFEAAPYYLIYSPQAQVRLSPEADTLLDTIRFNGPTSADTIPPEIVWHAPKGTASLAPRVAVAWSEPVRALLPALLLTDTLGDTIQCLMDTLPADTTIFRLKRSLLPGRAYRMPIPDTAFADLCGNHPLDTSDTPSVAIAFSSISEDNICFSLSGGSSCLKPADSRVWQFKPLGSTNIYTCADSGGSFRFDSIPAAQGFLAHFIDADGDGEPSDGRLFPWMPPEPYFSFADTIEARARWDIENITITDCEPCPEDTLEADTTETE
ncbi:MAG: hypothetical protein GF418_14365 [Chitinivibrionales bacterium]|nr:hypothetical protein [Chitinivibrionales bacterium]MBD3396804.1 hypothetical protein [Chitinivibrionales bacterium]